MDLSAILQLSYKNFIGIASPDEKLSKHSSPNESREQ